RCAAVPGREPPIDCRIVQSDPPRDPRAPACTAGVRIPTHGVEINGLLMQAGGGHRHPTIVLLHGFPGYDGALDVGQATRPAGLPVLAMHYRGAWGSDGRFSFANCIEDVDAAVAFLRDAKTAAQFRIDRAHIYAVGQSLGGFLAVMAAARSRHVKGVVS